MTTPPKITDVAVAVFIKPDGSFLLSSRPAGKPYAGYWEFPGGKIEPGESVRDALRRELIEELNVVIDACSPWFTFMMHYEHATVRLRTWRVTAWHDANVGGMRGMEGQEFAWQTSVALINVGPTLPGCVPIFRALALPTRYLISNASEIGADVYLQYLRAFSAKNARKGAPNGDFAFQVRERHFDRLALRAFAEQVLAVVRPVGGKVLISGDVDLVREIGADGVHLSAFQLGALVEGERPACDWVGASVHNADELARAAALKCDFVVMGSVKPTQSHPGQAPMGWPSFAALVADTPIPAYAIGGMTHADLGEAMTHCAHGIALQRAAFL
ncbi:MAG: Nudix family hydrolase [Burkholderiales bacterium]